MKAQAKSDFEKWYKVAYIEDSSALWKPVHNKSFFHLPDNMQWGVIQDWFDSVEIEISSPRYGKGFEGEVWEVINKENDWVWNSKRFDTRQEARTVAIEKAVEIYNSRK